jgi:hypothetical protein
VKKKGEPVKPERQLIYNMIGVFSKVFKNTNKLDNNNYHAYIL